MLTAIRDRMMEETKSLATPFSHGFSLDHCFEEAKAIMISRPGGFERMSVVDERLPGVVVIRQSTAWEHHAFRNSFGAKAGAPGREFGELIDEILERERQAVIDADIKNLNDEYIRSVALVMENGE